MKKHILERKKNIKFLSPLRWENKYYYLIVFLIFSGLAFPFHELSKATAQRTQVASYERCTTQPGTLVNLVPDSIKYPADIYYFNKQGQRTPIENCIPDLNQELVNNLSEQTKNQLAANFFAITSRSIRKVRTRSDVVLNQLPDDAKKDTNANIPDVFLLMQSEVKKGSILAYIDMHLHDYYTLDTSNYRLQFSEKNPHYQKLKKMAYNGDGDAMCLYSQRIPTPFPGYEHLTWEHDIPKDRAMILRNFKEGPDDKWLKGMIKAAKMEGSDCMAQYGSLLLTGKLKGIIPANRQLGIEYMEKAAKKNNERALRLLAYNYSTGNNGFEYNLGKAKCWATKLNSTFAELYPSLAFKISTYISIAKNKGVNLSDFPTYDPNNNCQLINNG
jgi:hypothetical protein